MFAGVGNFFPLSDPDRIIYDYAYAHNCAESSFPFELLCRNTSSRPSPPTADPSPVEFPGGNPILQGEPGSRQRPREGGEPGTK
jgi:hypothetical protein